FSGAHAGGAAAEPQVHALALERPAEQPRRERVLLVMDPISRVDEGDRDAVAGVDLRQLDAGRPRAEDGERARQGPRRGSLDVRPRVRLSQAREVGHTAVGADGEDDGAGLQDLVAHADPTWTVERRRA